MTGLGRYLNIFHLVALRKCLNDISVYTALDDDIGATSLIRANNLLDEI